MGNLLLLYSLLLSAIPDLGAEKCQTDSNLFSRNNSTLFRRKRASAISRFVEREGKRAVQKLLQGAEETPSNTYKFKSFQKSGGWDAALRDFLSIQPIGVIEYGGRYFDGINIDFLVGRVGDRNFLLKKQGRLGKPSIEIIKLTPRYPHHLVDKITYVD